jgi:hypothetical protein
MKFATTISLQIGIEGIEIMKNQLRIKFTKIVV